MMHYTTAYRLVKEDETLVFDSEKSACEYLGVSRCCVAGCYRRKVKCKGFTVEKIGITTHHSTNTRLYKVWCGMMERCYRVKHKHYKDYGGRGIEGCSQWKEFEPFRRWAISNGYSDTLTFDRINVNANYEPSNCRRATVKEQMSNKRTNHWVDANGEKMTITQCSEKYGIPKSTVRWRVANGRDVVTGAKMDAPTQKSVDNALEALDEVEE